MLVGIDNWYLSYKCELVRTSNVYARGSKLIILFNVHFSAQVRCVGQYCRIFLTRPWHFSLFLGILYSADLSLLHWKVSWAVNGCERFHVEINEANSNFGPWLHSMRAGFTCAMGLSWAFCGRVQLLFLSICTSTLKRCCLDLQAFYHSEFRTTYNSLCVLWEFIP